MLREVVLVDRIPLWFRGYSLPSRYGEILQSRLPPLYWHCERGWGIIVSYCAGAWDSEAR